jgi:transposase
MKKELYGGLDIHKESITGCILDKSGTIFREHTFPMKKKAVEKFIEGISNADVTFALEACGMWQGAYHLFSELGYTVKLANAKKTHDIAAHKKTDTIDAHILADLLRTCYLPEVWIPTDEIIQLREITRYKSRITRMRVQIQNKIKSTLLMKGIPYQKNVWNESYLEKLEALDPQLKSYVHLYRVYKEEETQVKKRIEKIAQNKQNPSLLLSIKGVGPLGALIIYAEIGDIHRFSSPKSLVSYAGLCPGVYQSSGTIRTVKNTNVNKWLKWIIYECSGKATQLDPRFKRYFNKIHEKKSYQVARRATARKMLTIIWYMLMKQEPYRHGSSS